MFDIGGIELLVIGVIALVVVGPKDLPRLVRSVSDIVRKIKNLSSEFRSGIDGLAREIDLSKEVDLDMDPFQELKDEEGLKPGMTPEEVTDHIMTNQEKKVSRKATVKPDTPEDPVTPKDKGFNEQADFADD